jgi:predicted glycogen debranching enzyme
VTAPPPFSDRAGDPGAPWTSAVIDGAPWRARGEWLLTNGTGAYASSTLACTHTRRYHGLLVAALDPPRQRHVLLSHVDASIVTRDVDGRARSHDLAAHQFPGVDPEQRPLALRLFAQDPIPRWRWSVAGGELEATLGLVPGSNAAVLRYAWRGPEPVVLKLRPLLAMRPFHALSRENGGMVQRVELRAGEVRVRPSKDLPRLCFRHEGTFVGSPD